MAPDAWHGARVTFREVCYFCLSTANRREDEKNERAAQLPEPPGLR